MIKDPNDELAVRARQFVKELDAELVAEARQPGRHEGRARRQRGGRGCPRLPTPPPKKARKHVDLLATRSTPATQEERPIYRRPWFWVVAGAVVAGGVVAALLLTRGGTVSDCPDCNLGATRVSTQ